MLRGHALLAKGNTMCLSFGVNKSEEVEQLLKTPIIIKYYFNTFLLTYVISYVYFTFFVSYVDISDSDVKEDLVF